MKELESIQNQADEHVTNFVNRSIGQAMEVAKRANNPLLAYTNIRKNEVISEFNNWIDFVAGDSVIAEDFYLENINGVICFKGEPLR